MFTQQMKRSTKAFTMIELLIVISVLGILAIGVLAAVDPFEQLKKARDTNTRSSVLALQTAFIRYYASHGALPWDDTVTLAGGGISCADGDTLFGQTRATTPLPISLDNAAMGSLTDPGTTCIGLLETGGELKPGFVAAIGSGLSANIFVSSKSSSQVAVCFPPQSKAVIAEENTKYSNIGVDLSTGQGALCAPGTQKVVNNCYYCAM